MMPQDDISIVLPAYNEEDDLRSAVGSILSYMTDREETVELIISEDGCTDRTPEIAADLASRHPEVTHVHFEVRQGQGRAIEQGFRQASGTRLICMDTDLSTDLAALDDMIAALDTCDVVIGSRYLPGSEIDRSLLRELLSRGYNRLIQVAFGSPVHDHQCGFKGIRREAFEQLSPLESAHWFWDTELLLEADAAGMRITEIPVHWERRGNSKINLGRAIIHFIARIIGYGTR